MKTDNTQIISALMISRTNAEAAERLSMSEAQLYARMKDRAFKQQLMETQAQLLARTSDLMLAKAAEAVSVISEIMADKENPASVRLSAANALLKQVTVLRQFQWEAEENDENRAWELAMNFN